MVEVPIEYKEKVLSGMDGCRIIGKKTTIRVFEEKRNGDSNYKTYGGGSKDRDRSRGAMKRIQDKKDRI